MDLLILRLSLSLAFNQGFVLMVHFLLSLMVSLTNQDDKMVKMMNLCLLVGEDGEFWVSMCVILM